MKVVIATNNEVKVEGAKRALSHYFKDVGNEQRDYYITQASIHIYRGEIGWMLGNDVKDPYGLLPYIKNLVNEAKN